jgi:hypothetical protein
MTVKGAYENILRELRKAKAPSLHLDDYNYFINKGIQEYINERYNKFQVSQQITDDISPLIVPNTFIISNNTGYYSSNPAVILNITTGKRYSSDFIKFPAPDNYWHMVGTNVTTVAKFPYKCYPKGHEDTKPSKKLNSHTANGIINNAYLKPSASRVFHDFTDGSAGSVLPNLTFYYGDSKKFNITEVSLDYLKKPEVVNLTVGQRDVPVDTSAVLEFPEYVCNEIIKRVVKLILENSSDPRLNTHVQVNQSTT